MDSGGLRRLLALLAIISMPIAFVIIFFAERWYSSNMECSEYDAEKLESSIKNELISEGENISGMKFHHEMDHYSELKKYWAIEFVSDKRLPTTGYIYCTGEVTVVDIPLASPHSSNEKYR